jgi:hypothetical protein
MFWDRIEKLVMKGGTRQREKTMVDTPQDMGFGLWIDDDGRRRVGGFHSSPSSSINRSKECHIVSAVVVIT